MSPPEEWIPAEPLGQRDELPARVGHVGGDQEEVRELGSYQPTLGIVLLACRGHELTHVHTYSKMLPSGEGRL